jgi:hypothetical protein
VWRRPLLRGAPPRACVHRRCCEQRIVGSLTCHSRAPGGVPLLIEPNRWSDRGQVSAKCGVVWVDRWGPSGANVRKACTPAMMAIRITGRVRSLCSWRALTRWLQARTALSSNTKSAVRLLRRGPVASAAARLSPRRQSEKEGAMRYVLLIYQAAPPFHPRRNGQRSRTTSRSSPTPSPRPTTRRSTRRPACRWAS